MTALVRLYPAAYRREFDVFGVFLALAGRWSAGTWTVLAALLAALNMTKASGDTGGLRHGRAFVETSRNLSRAGR